ncbi:unnamed protein product [Ectocarpus fasciculatus]
MSSSSSSSFNDSWRDAVSRSKSRRSSSSSASKSTTATALQTKAKIADTAAAGAAAADATAAPPSYATTSAKPTTAATTRQAQPQANQRFSQYLARFNMSPRQAVAAAISSPRRGAKSLSNNVFFAIGGSGGSGGSGSRGGGGGSSGGGGGGDGGVNGDDGGAGGTRLPRRQRDRERKTKGPSPPPPSLLPLTGPAALAATINSTLTVTTGRAAGERATGESITTSDSSFTSDSLSGSGCGGGGDGSGFGVATGDEGDVTPPPAQSLPWEHPPESPPPPACMPNLHQSSGSEGPSGSEDDEGFGLGGGSIEYRKFLLRRSSSLAGAKDTARVSTPGRRGLGTGSGNVEHKKFLLRRASSSAGANDTAAALSPPGGGTTGLPSSASASRRPASKGKGGLRSTGATAAAAGVTSSPTSSPGASLPPRAPRLAAVPAVANSRVQPSTAPPPPPQQQQPARKLTVGASAPAATPTRSPTRGTPESFSASKLLLAKAATTGKEQRQEEEEDEEEDERRNFFLDPRLEATLALIRSGQAFCQERHIVVDFVRRAKPTTVGLGKAELQPMDELTRHALLLTDAALYLLEVEMLPPVPPRSPSPGQARPPSQAGSPESTEQGSFPRSPNVVGPGARGGGGVATVAVKSIKLMDRLLPSELLKVSLPFREVTLKNGDVVAKRGCGIVLHTSVEGREGNLWLKCRSNQDRGALVEAIVPWFETNSPTRRELNVQQVPESQMARQLARLNAAGGSDVMRRKDTDCLIS